MKVGNTASQFFGLRRDDYRSVPFEAAIAGFSEALCTFFLKEESLSTPLEEVLI